MQIYISLNSWNGKCFEDVEKIRTHFYVQEFFPHNCVVYLIMWKNKVQPDRARMTKIRRRKDADTDTHSQLKLFNQLFMH